MSLVLTRLRDALRVLRWSRREQKTALLGAACFAASPVLRLLPFDAPYQKVATWAPIVLGSAFVVVTLLRLRRYSLAPPAPKAVPGVVAIKGAGSFTPEDAELFSRLRRLEELKQLRNGVLDVHKVPVVAVMGESGVGKTSLLRAGLELILDQEDKPLPRAYWEADPRGARESFLQAVEAQLGTRDLKSLPHSVIVVDQLEQLDPGHNAEFFKLLREHLEAEPPFRSTWIVAFRREYASTWLNFQSDLPEHCRHRPQVLLLKRFSLRQAKEVFATLAEEADLPVRQSLVAELVDRLAEDGSISPVDLGITLQALHLRPDLAENPAAFRSVGGHAGLLTSYLEMTLEPYSPTLRGEVLQALLGLVEEGGEHRRVEGRRLDELLAIVHPQVPHHLELALEALAQPGVRVLEILEERPRRYRLIHERFIPALHRLAGELLGAVDRASRLLERRFRSWEREGRPARYLLHGRELREILGHRTSLRWGKSQEEKLRFLETSRRRRRWRRLLAAAAVGLLLLSTTVVIHEQRVRAAQKEMFEWGLPEGTYELLPRITDLALPQVSNTRWLPRAESLGRLSLSLAPQYTTERGEAWPPSLQELSLDLRASGVSSCPALPPTLQRLSLDAGFSPVATWLELPSSLQRLDLTVSIPGIASWPDFPPALQQLNLDVSGSGVGGWLELPPSVQQLSLGVFRSEVASWPELPPSVRQLTLTVFRSQVDSWPVFPSALQQLNLRLSDSQVESWPDFPTPLRQLALNLRNSQAETWPDLPLALEELVLDSHDSEVPSWPALPPALKELALRTSEGTSWPEVPSSLQQLTLRASEAGSWPAWPPALQQLTLDVRGSQLASLPAWPPSLQELTLYISGSEGVSWPELPSSLQELTLYVSGTEVESWPAWPPSLQRLTLGLRGPQVQSWPVLPSFLQHLTLDTIGSEVMSWPELPSQLQQLTFYLRGSEVVSWPELPKTLRCLALEVSPGASMRLPELPVHVKRFQLAAREGFGLDRFSCRSSSD